MVIMQGPATTLPAKGIAQNCLIRSFSTMFGLVVAEAIIDHCPCHRFLGSAVRSGANGDDQRNGYGRCGPANRYLARPRPAR
jgi:hypothetical protein